MNKNYDQLRFSFDNILKELDDICRSIDDLTDIEHLPSSSNEKPPVNRTAAYNTKKYQNYQLSFNIDALLNKNFPNTSNAYEQYKKNVYSQSTSQQPSTSHSSTPTSATFPSTDLTRPNLVESFNDSLNHISSHASRCSSIILLVFQFRSVCPLFHPN